MTKNSRQIIAVGDIHGCHTALGALLRELMILPWPCVFLGDYLDRGESSVLVIDQLLRAKAARRDWKFLMGNHEEMFLADLDRHVKFFEAHSAGDDYAKVGGIPSAHRQFLSNLLPWWESDKFLFVHGGIAKNVHLPVADHELDELLWTYHVSPKWRGKIIVRGHQVVDVPRQHHNQIDLDTGCCFGRALTAGILDDESGLMSGYIQATYDGEIRRFSRMTLGQTSSRQKERVYG